MQRVLGNCPNQPLPNRASKIGVVIADAPQMHRTLDQALLPALARKGQHVDPANVVAINLGSDSAVLSGIQNAVLKFRSSGVTHVIIIDGGGGITLFFAQDARQQKYFPRYGLDSYNGAQLWINTGVLAPADFAGAVGAGWVPLLDLPAAKNPLNGPSSNKARQRCVALMKAGGQDLPDVNAERHAVNLCDELWLIEAGFRKPGATPTRDSFLASVASLGSSFVDGQTFTTNFSPRPRDGVSTAQAFTMDGSCNCFAYVGPRLPL